MAAIKTIPVKGPNKIAAPCESCKRNLKAGEGMSFVRGDWKSVCNSTACAEAAFVTLPDHRRRMLADGTVRMPKEYDALPLLRALPGAKFDKEQLAWHFSLKVEHRARVIEIGEQLKLDIDKSLRKFSLGRAVANRVKAAKEVGLFDFQLVGVEYSASHDRCFIGDDMGTGKTASELMALPPNAQVIAVVPQNVKVNWGKDEGPRWRPDLSYRIIYGRQKNVADILPKVGEVVIINYEILPADLKPVPTGEMNDWNGKEILRAKVSDKVKKVLAKVTLIADEAHRAKNYKAQRTQRLTELSRLCGRVHGMSGTPLVNRPPDLWGTLKALGMAHDIFGSWNKFVELFGGYDNGYGIAWPEFRDRPVAPEAAERLRHLMIRRTKAEVLPDLPPKMYETMTVNGTSKRLMKKLDDLYVEWRDVLDAGELPAFESFSEIRKELAASRIPAMLERVEAFEDAGKPVLVFSAHRAPIEEVGKREGWATIIGGMAAEARQDVVRRFQAGELKGVGLTIKAGCEGLTLTNAADVIFVDLDWVPALNSQAEDRVCRIGQTADKITIMRMVSDHALDKHVMNLLADKTAMIEQTLNAKVEIEVPDYKAAVNETEADMKARLQKNDAVEAARREAIEQAQREADEKAWQEKVERIHGRQIERANGKGFDIRSRELTPVIIDALKRAYSYMLAVCDGAVERDDMGFNKPDASMARILMHHDLNSEETQYALWAILCRYHRQLGQEYPAIFARKWA